VTLTGHAVINDDVATKTANWLPQSYRWHPGGPGDPNVVYIDFTTERIELWSSAHAVVRRLPIVTLWWMARPE
jgi:general stress protein 26